MQTFNADGAFAMTLFGIERQLSQLYQISSFGQINFAERRYKIFPFGAFAVAQCG